MFSSLCPNCGHDQDCTPDMAFVICTPCGAIWVPQWLEDPSLTPSVRSAQLKALSEALWTKFRMVRNAKEVLIEIHDFETAARLRDQERRTHSIRLQLEELGDRPISTATRQDVASVLDMSKGRLVLQWPKLLVVNAGQPLRHHTQAWLDQVLGELDLRQLSTDVGCSVDDQVFAAIKAGGDVSAVDAIIDGLDIAEEDWRLRGVVVLSDNAQNTATPERVAHLIMNSIVDKQGGQPVRWMYFGEGLSLRRVDLLPRVWGERPA